MTRPPWLPTMLATLRATGSLVEARQAAGVNQREVTSACEATPGLREELEAARAEGVVARKGGAGGDRDHRVGSGGALASGQETHEAAAPSARTSRNTGATRGASGAVDAEGWRRAAEASAAREAEDTGRMDASAERWARAREKARELGGDGSMGHLLWVERRCVEAKLHAMDPQWLFHFDEFYGSGKFLDVGRFGLRAAKSDSVCRAIVAEVLFIERRLEPSMVGVCPVMSANMREAGDRFDTIKANLRACGLQDLTGMRGKEAEDNAFKTMGGGQQALVIALQDAQAHPVEFRIYPASEVGAAGFTGIAGFGDELDLWGKATGANPASRVIEILVTRFTTQPEAKLHLMSATYDRESFHAALIDKGDTPLQRVARLGLNGALRDAADRRRLAAKIQSTDPLLLAPGDPNSTDIPSWVSNPVAPIEDCYAKSDGNLRRMFALYGGRPEFAGDTANMEAQCVLAARVTERLAERFGGQPRRKPDELIKVAGARPGDARYAGPPTRTGGGFGINWKKRGML